MNEKYTDKQIAEAKRLTKVLASVSAGKRSLFSLMLESMMIGAELAEAQYQVTPTS